MMESSSPSSSLAVAATGRSTTTTATTTTTTTTDIYDFLHNLCNAVLYLGRKQQESKTLLQTLVQDCNIVSVTAEKVSSMQKLLEDRDATIRRQSSIIAELQQQLNSYNREEQWTQTRKYSNNSLLSDCSENNNN